MGAVSKNGKIRAHIRLIIVMAYMYAVGLSV
jgi:hypothetical protein